MPQTRVKVLSVDSEGCITLLVENSIVEYYFQPDYMHFLVPRLKQWISSEWTNYIVAFLTAKAERVVFFGKSPLPNIGGEQRMSSVAVAVDAQKTPSAEYPYTLIATTAKSVTYRNDRSWFKTAEDARVHAQSIYDMNKNESFDLAVVKCEDVIRPKPRTEIISTWNKSA